MENFDHIKVFKTNILTGDDRESLKPLLDSHGDIDSWNVDLSDVDHVLRVVTRRLSTPQIIDIINQCGFLCRELT